ncbi:MAG: flavodoxin domain-containing protein [Patescibacteria group bacterium]|uniref:Flavodoxin domain-containing protein n=1 Tax=candidate division WWE3 bacterium TaxID=2053526 RepID=A0A955J280_UNCKA|nr:flavodoxin domain-containing protein [candidate division WWE3 bacterium]
MNALIVYASNSGSTMMTANIIAKSLKNYKSIVKPAAETNANEFASYDLVLLGSNSWWVNNLEGQPHETMLELMQGIKDSNNTFENTCFAVFGCGDSNYLKFCNAVDMIHNTLTQVGANVLGNKLKVDGFFYNIEENTALITQWATQLEVEVPVKSLL